MTLCYKYENSFERTRSPVKEGDEINVTPGNADWHLFQLGRDITLTKMIFEQWKNNQFIEGVLPKSLKTFGKPDYDMNEVNLYIQSLKAYIQYLIKIETPVKVEVENIKTKISNYDQRIKEASNERLKEDLERERSNFIKQLERESFNNILIVRKLLKTRIVVDGKYVSVQSEDDNLVKFIKKEVVSFQVQTTSGN